MGWVDWIESNREWVFSGIGLSIIALCAAIVRLVWLRAQSGFGGNNLPANRRHGAEKLILGKWVGETTDTERSKGELKRYAVTWDFYKRGKHILCRSPATYSSEGKTKTDEYELGVRVLDNRFFLIEFYNTSQVALNFGCEVLELSDNGEEFRGRFVAYSPDDKDIISGTIVGRRTS